MNNKNFHAHASTGNVVEYKSYKIAPVEVTGEGWTAIIRRANGKPVTCQGVQNDHFRTMNAETMEYAIALAKGAIDTQYVI